MLSAVLVSPLPHSLPGSTPTWPRESTTAPPLRSTIASSPLNSEPEYVWSAWARIAGAAAAAAKTNTSPAATVPVRATFVEVVAPLKKSWSW